MANYNGQRGPNVSEFIANLNAIPSVQDMTMGQASDFNLDDDLAMFTNTQFFDFDLGQDADLQSTNFDLNGSSRIASVAGPDQMKSMDFGHQGNYAFPDFTTFPLAGGLPATILPPLQTGQPVYASSSIGSPTSGLVSPLTSDKANIEDTSRVAAEEDKRRRNTAASARFRVKKKQREQALEKSAKEMSDKVSALEGRINQLETENKWLRNLVMEKNDNKDDIAALWAKYTQETAATERKVSDRKDGVGTKKEA